MNQQQLDLFASTPAEPHESPATPRNPPPPPSTPPPTTIAPRVLSSLERYLAGER